MSFDLPIIIASAFSVSGRHICTIPSPSCAQLNLLRMVCAHMQGPRADWRLFVLDSAHNVAADRPCLEQTAVWKAALVE